VLLTEFNNIKKPSNFAAEFRIEQLQVLGEARLSQVAESVACAKLQESQLGCGSAHALRLRFGSDLI
jgi:hypothetical protein